MVYKGAKLLQIAMPMGGIGAGCICLNGYGGLQDFSIYNKPSTSAQADGHGFRDAAFAMIHIKGDRPLTRLVEGPIPPEKLYNQGLQGQGYRGGGHEGIPRFENCEFESRYPFGIVTLSDSHLPIKAKVEGWSPFVPNDDKVSGIPAAILRYTFENTTDREVDFEFSYHMAHAAPGSKGETGTRNRLIGDGGICFSNSDDKPSEAFGSAAFAIDATNVQRKGMWFRGGWFDSISALYREVSTGSFSTNDGSRSELGLNGRNGGSALVPLQLKPGEKVSLSVVIAWHFPNVPFSVGIANNVKMAWHPWYTTQWIDAGVVATYVLKNLPTFESRTRAFADALYRSSLPPVALDAIAANLAIIKSPTVLRQSSGNLWAWEGCFVGSGCCHGSCTHVWNYAQAIPHLFPALERTFREQEYVRSMDPSGHINFRSALPDNPTTHDYHAASDGQLGGIMKLYRDWQISGDDEWLRRLYPLAKRSLDYCIQTWDPDRIGVLIEPHHNTYDIEFWGADGMCSSIYIGALCAMAEIERHLGQSDSADEYYSLAERGATYLDSKLFNGEYYEQHVQWQGLRDTSFTEQITEVGEDCEDDVLRLLKQEGPKYQYGIGCISDGVIGAWMATLYGIDTPLNKENVRSHLKSIYRYNFREDLFDHACLQRPGYALGHEAGLLLCTWPKGGKPTLPFVYSDEVWTGIEYQVASHCLCEGLNEEGLKIVEGARSRYEGHVRNPFNEYECGNYYARALASYALLQSITGFQYLAVTKTLRLNPTDKEMTTFFSTASGFGTITWTNQQVTIKMTEGSLDVATLYLGEETRTVNASALVGVPLVI